MITMCTLLNPFVTCFSLRRRPPACLSTRQTDASSPNTRDVRPSSTHAYDDLAFAAGDGVVLASAAMLPRGYRCVKDGKVETGRGHVGLLEAVGKTLQVIIDTRAKGVGLGTDHPRWSGNCLV